MEKLTVKEKEVYDFICRNQRCAGYAPSVRDIQTALNFKSTSTVKDYIDRLEYEIGVISRMGYVNYYLIVWDFIRYAKELV